MIVISDFGGLVNAIEKVEKEIVVSRSFLCLYSVVLPKGTTLRGLKQEYGEYPSLSFDGDGVGVSCENSIADLNIFARADRKAVFNATSSCQDLGVFNFRNLTLTGQFSFIARSGAMSAKVNVDHLDIVTCDSRHYLEQPEKYGVNALQGAFTVYNFNGNSNSRIELTATNISVGRKTAPVVGSGIFISGFGDTGGKVFVDKLQTGAVYSNGKIPFGVSTIITASVFIVNGVEAKEVVHDGEIASYGANDMVLDTWGKVDTWVCNQPITSYGPSGIGFVNFGIVNDFRALAPLRTFGLGARGYNQYDGTVSTIYFESIETFGDGSLGIQLGKKIGTLTVNKSITTHGGVGNSLVKGVNMELPATAFSVKNGGEADKITVKGNIETFGKNITAYSVDSGGIVRDIFVGGKIVEHANQSKK